MPVIIPSAKRFVIAPDGKFILTQSASDANEESIKSIGTLAHS